jgi:hypothetical protein
MYCDVRQWRQIRRTRPGRTLDLRTTRWDFCRRGRAAYAAAFCSGVRFQFQGNSSSTRLAE